MNIVTTTLFFSIYFQTVLEICSRNRRNSYLPPGLPEGDYNLHHVCASVLVLVSNNIHIDIKQYFCFVYQSILKYPVVDVFGERPSKLSRKF